jgi:hypothetical protein
MIDSIFQYETLQETAEGLLKSWVKHFATDIRYVRKEYYMDKSGQYVAKQKKAACA